VVVGGPEYMPFWVSEFKRWSQLDSFKGRFVYVPHSDTRLLKMQAIGADICINIPRPLEEACGTSDQRTGLNGGVNIAIRGAGPVEWIVNYNETTGEGSGFLLDTYAFETEEGWVADNALFYSKAPADILRKMKVAVKLFMDQDKTAWKKLMHNSYLAANNKASAKAMEQRYALDVYLPAIQAKVKTIQPEAVEEPVVSAPEKTAEAVFVASIPEKLDSGNFMLKNRLISEQRFSYLKSIAAAVSSQSKNRALYIASGADYSNLHIATGGVQEAILIDRLPYIGLGELSPEEKESCRVEYFDFKRNIGFASIGSLNEKIGLRQYIYWELQAMGAKIVNQEYDRALEAYRINFVLPGENQQKSIIYFQIEDLEKVKDYPQPFIELLGRGLDFCMQKASGSTGYSIRIPKEIISIITAALDAEGVIISDSAAAMFFLENENFQEATEELREVRGIEKKFGLDFGYGRVEIISRNKEIKVTENQDVNTVDALLKAAERVVLEAVHMIITRFISGGILAATGKKQEEFYALFNDRQWEQARKTVELIPDPQEGYTTREKVFLSNALVLLSSFELEDWPQAGQAQEAFLKDVETFKIQSELNFAGIAAVDILLLMIKLKEAIKKQITLLAEQIYLTAVRVEGEEELGWLTSLEFNKYLGSLDSLTIEQVTQLGRLLASRVPEKEKFRLGHFSSIFAQLRIFISLRSFLFCDDFTGLKSFYESDILRKDSKAAANIRNSQFGGLIKKFLEKNAAFAGSASQLKKSGNNHIISAAALPALAIAGFFCGVLPGWLMLILAGAGLLLPAFIEAGYSLISKKERLRKIDFNFPRYFSRIEKELDLEFGYGRAEIIFKTNNVDLPVDDSGNQHFPATIDYRLPRFYNRGYESARAQLIAKVDHGKLKFVSHWNYTPIGRILSEAFTLTSQGPPAEYVEIYLTPDTGIESSTGRKYLAQTTRLPKSGAYRINLYNLLNEPFEELQELLVTPRTFCADAFVKLICTDEFLHTQGQDETHQQLKLLLKRDLTYLSALRKVTEAENENGVYLSAQAASAIGLEEISLDQRIAGIIKELQFPQSATSLNNLEIPAQAIPAIVELLASSSSQDVRARIVQVLLHLEVPFYYKQYFEKFIFDFIFSGTHADKEKITRLPDTWFAGQKEIVSGRMPTLARIFSDNARLARFLFILSVLRLMYSYDKVSYKPMFAIDYAQKTGIQFSLGELLIVPVTESFRRHIIYVQDTQGRLAVEIKMPGQYIDRGDITPQHFTIAEALWQKFPDDPSAPKPLFLIQLKGEFSFYERRINYEDNSLNIIGFEYQDSKRYCNVLAAFDLFQEVSRRAGKTPQALEESNIIDCLVSVVKVHLLGYQGNYSSSQSSGYEMHMENIALLSSGRLILAGDFGSLKYCGKGNIPLADRQLETKNLMNLSLPVSDKTLIAVIQRLLNGINTVEERAYLAKEAVCDFDQSDKFFRQLLEALELIAQGKKLDPACVLFSYPRYKNLLSEVLDSPHSNILETPQAAINNKSLRSRLMNKIQGMFKPGSGKDYLAASIGPLDKTKEAPSDIRSARACQMPALPRGKEELIGSAIEELRLLSGKQTLDFSDPKEIENLAVYLEDKGMGVLYSCGIKSKDLSIVCPSGNAVIGSARLSGIEDMRIRYGQTLVNFILTRALKEIQDVLKRYGGLAHLEDQSGVIKFTFRSGLDFEENKRLLGLIFKILNNRLAASYTGAVLHVESKEMTESIRKTIHEAVSDVVSDFIGIAEASADNTWKIIFNGRGRNPEKLKERLGIISQVLKNELAAKGIVIEVSEEFTENTKDLFIEIGPFHLVDWQADNSSIDSAEAGHGNHAAVVMEEINFDSEPLLARDVKKRLAPAVENAFKYRPGIKFKSDGMSCHSSSLYYISQENLGFRYLIDLPGGYIISVINGKEIVIPTFTELYRHLPRLAYTPQREVEEDPQAFNYILSVSNLNNIARLLQIHSEDTVLDLFSGTGSSSLDLALYAGEVVGIDIANGAHHAAELNYAMFKQEFSKLPLAIMPRLSSAIFIRQDIFDLPGLTDKIGNRKFSRIHADCPFGWGVSWNSEEEGFKLCLASLAVISRYLEADGIAGVRITREWLRRGELLECLDRNQLYIRGIHDDLDSKAAVYLELHRTPVKSKPSSTCARPVDSAGLFGLALFPMSFNSAASNFVLPEAGIIKYAIMAIGIVLFLVISRPLIEKAIAKILERREQRIKQHDLSGVEKVFSVLFLSILSKTTIFACLFLSAIESVKNFILSLFSDNPAGKKNGREFPVSDILTIQNVHRKSSMDMARGFWGSYLQVRNIQKVNEKDLAYFLSPHSKWEHEAAIRGQEPFRRMANEANDGFDDREIFLICHRGKCYPILINGNHRIMLMFTIADWYDLDMKKVTFVSDEVIHLPANFIGDMIFSLLFIPVVILMSRFDLFANAARLYEKLVDSENSPYSLPVSEESGLQAEQRFGKNKNLTDVNVENLDLAQPEAFVEDHYNALQRLLKALELRLGRAPPELALWRLILTTNSSLTGGNIAACDINNKIVYIHVAFFELPFAKQLEILYHELISHIAKGIRDE
ncbi:MAG TPA: hypothetical protein PKI44_05560, partial [Candidatus Omnitrophota bacterium]|nr:hypothetical protein [Candidatus Omnitrophota bacterium]